MKIVFLESAESIEVSACINRATSGVKYTEGFRLLKVII